MSAAAAALELRYCRAFVAVVEEGGPTRASAVLGLSQSTVSEALLALERALGAPLFVRKGKTATYTTLTAAGRAFLPHAQALLAAADSAVLAVQRSSGQSYTLVIGATESLSTYVLPPLLAALADAWPAARIHVEIGLCEDLRESVARGNVSIAFVLEARRASPETAGSGRRRQLVSTVLGRARPVLVAAPDHPFVGVQPSTAQLASQILFRSDSTGAFRELLEDAFGSSASDLANVRIVGSVDAVKRSVVSDHRRALGFTSWHAVSEELQRESLVEIRPARAFSPLYLKAIVASDRELDPVLVELASALQRHSLTG